MTIYRELRDLTDLDRADAVIAMTNMRDGDDDFEIGDFIFVKNSNLDEYLGDYLWNDEYGLGCFSSWFLSQQTELDGDVFDALIEAEAFEAIGKIVIKYCDKVEFAAAASSADSYGHFLNSYDGNEIEIGEYTAFQQG